MLQEIELDKSRTHKKNEEPWTLPISDYDLDLYFEQLQNEKDCFNLLSTSVEHRNTTLVSDTLKYFLMPANLRRSTWLKSRDPVFPITRKIKYTPKLENLKETKRLANKLNVKYGGFVSDSLIEEQLTQCGKTVFVGERSLVLKELEYLNLNYKNKLYLVDDEPFFVARSGIAYSQSLGPAFQKYITSIVQSGIYSRLFDSYNAYKCHIRKLYTSRAQKSSANNLESIDKIRITGSIQTLFYLCLIFVIVCSLCLVFESKISRFRKSYRSFRVLYAMIISDAYYRIRIGFSLLWFKTEIWVWLGRKTIALFGKIRIGIAFYVGLQ